MPPKPKYTIYRDESSTEPSIETENKDTQNNKHAQDEKQQQQQHETESGDTWDGHKENIQPISQGRKIRQLFQALTLIDDTESRKDLVSERREQFEKELKEKESNKDADGALDLWVEYIDWLEQNVPDGGKINQITQAIEKCIELFYDKKKFKQDKRLFNVFMKFRRFCQDPVEVFGFMYANCISTLLAEFYLNWSWSYECMKSMKRAEDLLKLGLKNLASPRELLVEAEAQLKSRLVRMIRAGELEQQVGSQSGGLSAREARAQLASSGIRAALQTLRYTKGAPPPVRRTGSAVVEDSANVGGLKSQVKLVNGVPVKNNNKPTKHVSNKPVLVCVDEEPSNQLPSLHQLKSQPIKTVGRSGSENQVPSSGKFAE